VRAVPKASKIDRPHRVRTAPPLRRCSAPTLTPMLRAYVCQSTVSLSSRGRSFGISQSLPCACAAKTATAFGLRRRSASARRPVWEVGGRHGQLLDAGHAHRPPARHWWLRWHFRSDQFHGMSCASACIYRVGHIHHACAYEQHAECSESRVRGHPILCTGPPPRDPPRDLTRPLLS
jgi:hypothetical protein